MIALNHLNLDNIAKSHHAGITSWAYHERLIPLLILYREFYIHRYDKAFPKKELDKIKVAIGKKKKVNYIASFQVLHKDISLVRVAFQILTALEKNWDTLIKGTPSQLDNLKTTLDPYFSPYQFLDSRKNLKYKTEFGPIAEWIAYIFDYSSKFLKKETEEKKWDAYRLAEALEVDVCPYCNRQYTNTIIYKNSSAPKVTFDKIIRPEFDHFYPQSRFPYLALSFYNLVPSCKVCNSSLKGDTEMDLEKHIHPYLGGYHDHLKFRTGIDPRTYLKNKQMAIPIKIQPQASTAKQQLRAANSSELFKLEKIYHIHADIARDIFKKTTNNSQKYLKKMKFESHNGSRLFDDEKELYLHFIGNYMPTTEFHRRPLAKFQYDIAEETGLLDFIKKLK